MIRDAYSLALDPLLPWWLIAILAGAFLALVSYALARRARGAFLRLLAGAALTAILLNPSLVEEQRAYQKDIGAGGGRPVAQPDPGESRRRRRRDHRQAARDGEEFRGSRPAGGGDQAAAATMPKKARNCSTRCARRWPTFRRSAWPAW